MALSAIQDALSTRDAAAEAQAGSSPAPQVSAAKELQWLGISSAPYADVRQSAKEISSRSAANNDRQSIGNLLQALQRRLAGTSYVTAMLLACLWLLAGLVLAWIYLPAMWAALGPTGIAAPLLTIVFFVPIIFLYVLAHDPGRRQQRPSRSEPRHFADQRARCRAGQRSFAAHHPHAIRQGRAYYARARKRRRCDDGEIGRDHGKHRPAIHSLPRPPRQPHPGARRGAFRARGGCRRADDRRQQGSHRRAR